MLLQFYTEIKIFKKIKHFHSHTLVRGEPLNQISLGLILIKNIKPTVVHFGHQKIRMIIELKANGFDAVHEYDRQSENNAASIAASYDAS